MAAGLLLALPALLGLSLAEKEAEKAAAQRTNALETTTKNTQGLAAQGLLHTLPPEQIKAFGKVEGEDAIRAKMALSQNNAVIGQILKATQAMQQQSFQDVQAIQQESVAPQIGPFLPGVQGVAAAPEEAQGPLPQGATPIRQLPTFTPTGADAARARAQATGKFVGTPGGAFTATQAGLGEAVQAAQTAQQRATSQDQADIARMQEERLRLEAGNPTIDTRVTAQSLPNGQKVNVLSITPIDPRTGRPTGKPMQIPLTQELNDQAPSLARFVDAEVEAQAVGNQEEAAKAKRKRELYVESTAKDTPSEFISVDDKGNFIRVTGGAGEGSQTLQNITQRQAQDFVMSQVDAIDSMNEVLSLITPENVGFLSRRELSLANFQREAGRFGKFLKKQFGASKAEAQDRVDPVKGKKWLDAFKTADTSALQSLMISLAFDMAKAQNGGRLTDQDFDKAAEQVGLNLTFEDAVPRILAQRDKLMRQLKRRGGLAFTQDKFNTIMGSLDEGMGRADQSFLVTGKGSGTPAPNPTAPLKLGTRRALP